MTTSYTSVQDGPYSSVLTAAAILGVHADNAECDYRTVLGGLCNKSCSDAPFDRSVRTDALLSCRHIV